LSFDHDLQPVTLLSLQGVCDHSWHIALPCRALILLDVFLLVICFQSACQAHKISGTLNVNSVTRVVAVSYTAVAVVSSFVPAGL
jgi:hypothetical protein